MFKVQSSKFFKLAVAALAFASHAAFAAPISFSGELSNTDPTYNRAFSTTALSNVGTRVAYDVFGFVVSATSLYSIEVTSANPANLDTFISLYKGAFDAAQPLKNLLAVDDDSGTGAFPLLTNQKLGANTEYFLVVSSYGNNDFGKYKGVFNTVSGNGQVSLSAQVPEPGTLALLPLALAGMGLARRRRG